MMRNAGNGLFYATLIVAACAPADSGNTATVPDSTAPVARADSVVPADFSPASAGITYTGHRSRDLTGDGTPETITVTVTGPRADSATAHLSIVGSSGDTLYQDRWNTSFYFHYVDRATFTDSAATALVVAHLRRVLSDSAFTTPRGALTLPDRDAVLYDLKEQAVRERYGIPAGTPLQPAQHDEMNSTPIPSARVDSLLTELKQQPTFMYHAGGEITYILSYSPTLKRMVRIFSCC